PTAAVVFTTTTPGSIFSWVNDNTAIGLAANGNGDIPSFIAQNPGSTPIVANITVTPGYGSGGLMVLDSFLYTGAVQTWVVPAGVTSIHVKAYGGQGNNNTNGNPGGLGGFAEGDLAVTPGQTLWFNVGGGATTNRLGAFNGGGDGGVTGCATSMGGGGGGASDVRNTANTLANRRIVAAGGGGAAGDRIAGCGRGTGGGGGGGYYGGGGGAGWPFASTVVPTGGTQSAGGAGGTSTYTSAPNNNGFPGASGIGGRGGDEVASNQGTPSRVGPVGGVGGGLIGANGAYVLANTWTGQSGAGGSSYIGGVTAGVTTSGVRTGAGKINISYAAAGVSCVGTPKTFTITVNPNAALVIVADPGTVLCKGDPTLLTVYDAAPGAGATVSITHSSSNTITAGNSVACNAGTTGQVNSYWRAYNLNNFPTVTGDYTITSVRFGVEAILGGSVPITVNLYNQTGAAFPGGTRTLIKTQTYTLPVQSNTLYTATFTTPVTVPNTSTVIVEVTNATVVAGVRFFIGSNAAAETDISYLSSSACAINTPTPIATVGFPNMHMIIGLNGTLPNLGPQSTGTFLWSPAAGLSSTTSNPVAASPMVTTTYTVRRTTAQGCRDSAQITITIKERPKVTTQPIAAVSCATHPATFTVGGIGAGIAYQWQVNTAGCGGGGTWTNLANGAPYAGVNTATLTVNPTTGAMDGYGYRCVLSGDCSPILGENISNCAVLTVNPLPVVAITPPSACGGVQGMFGVKLSVGSAPPPVPGAVTATSGAINLAVPDNTANGVNNVINVAGVPANATITNVSVTLNMSHTYPGDMIFHLKAPNGQILNLYKYGGGLFTGPASGVPTWGWYGATVSRNGSTAWSTVNAPPYIYNNSTPWRADAINGVVPGPTVQNPTGFVSNAATFNDLYTNGPSTNGAWTLAMCDGGPGDVGTLASWTVKIDYTVPGGGGGPVLTYVWSPLAGLFLDSLTTIPYAGSNTSVVWAAPTVFTTYTVVATNTTTGCIDSAKADINYTPPPPVVTPNPVTMCLGDPSVRLVASTSTPFTKTVTSGTISVPIPDETANPTLQNLSVSGIPAGAIVTSMVVTLNMPHTYPADMVFNLRAPNGAILSLFKHNGNTNNGPAAVPNAGFFNAKVSSASSVPFTAVPNPFRYGETAPAGPYKADALNGVTNPGYVIMDPVGWESNAAGFASLYSVPNGTYTLAMCDGGPGDLGTLTSWSIDINYVVGVPATAATWSPITHLWNDSLRTQPYTGDARDTVWTRPTPAGVYNYDVTAQSLPLSGTIPLPGQVSTFTGSVRGYFFTAPSPFIMTSVEVPTTASTGNQSIAVVRFTGATPPPAFPGTTNAFTTLFLTQNNPAAGAIPVNIPINAGDVIGIMGYRGTTNSYSATGGVPTVINGFPVTLRRMGMQFPLTTTAPQQIWSEVAGAISRVYFSYGLPVGQCTSPKRRVVVTVNQPTTVATQPVDKTVCTDKVATFTVVAAGTGPFSYQWQVSTNGNNPPWNNVTNGGVYSGATTATLTITAPPVTLNGNFYRVVITGAAPCAAATSNAVRLTVNPLPVITLTASPYTSLFPGLRTTLSATVTPNAASTYNWIRDGVTLVAGSQGVLSGIGTANLEIDVDGMGVYTLNVTDVNGCNNTSNSVTIKDSVSAKCFLYPNPTDGKFEVRYYSVANNTNLPRYLNVYNTIGNRVLSQEYRIGRPYDRMVVDMRNQGKGVYFVEVADVNGNRLTVCKVVIQ
ncbi:MAG: glycine-rich protein, partial [Ferruginibacter sp.]